MRKPINAYICHMLDKRLIAFEKLLNIMDDLREKCPWDREQTMESLRYLTIEEVYELSDAILNNNSDEIKKEVGDVFLHLVFYSKIASEENKFDITEMIETLCEKLIRRHPHIYGDVKVENTEDVKQNWEQIKQKEHKNEKSTLDGVPKSMPSMVKAMRIQEKAAAVGFDWKNKKDVWDKVKEEINEFEAETDAVKREQEFGDVLFALINYARFQNINADDALEMCNKKFISRFKHIEKRAKELNKPMTEMELEEMEKYWQEAKSLS